ncbi:MAG: hypothetical protein HS128_19245 [Ideonella sp.]|nr:hypothetical protein [Ideonella sp.]MCC7455973.1 hypothetical protein [Nitrospira sp.]
MSALDFGAGSASNTTRRYTTGSSAALPDTGWAVGCWIRHGTVSGNAVLLGCGASGAASSMQLRTFVGSQYGSQARDASGSNVSDGINYPAAGDYLLVAQYIPPSDGLRDYLIPKGATVTAADSASAATFATIIPASPWYIGSDGTDWAKTPLGEAFVVGRVLSHAELTTLAAGASILAVEPNPLLYWPFRDGAVDQEVNLGTEGSGGDATRVGTGYTEVAEFFPIPQEAAPTADVSDGAWTPSTGADNYAVIDEATASDADYASVGSNSTLRVGLAALSTPGAGTQTVAFRAGGSPAKKLIVRLIEGASTSRGSLTVDPLGAVSDYSFNPSGIANFADLDLEFETADATSPPSPTITFGAIGTGANGSTSVAPSYPSGITAGQYLVCVVTSGGSANPTPSTPSGWTLLATGASTDGTWGVDAGPRRVTVFGKVAAGSESGTLSVTITGGNTCRGTISRFTKSQATYSWDVVAQGGNDSTSGTGFSAATSAIDWAVGDATLVAVGQRVDSATQSSQSLTASGITFGTRTNRASTAVTTGNDHRHVVDTFAAITAGSGSAAPTWAYTASASVSGGVVIVRLREVAPAEAARVTWARVTVPAAGGVELAGSAAAQGAAAAALTLAKALAADAAGSGAATGALSKAVALAASAAAQAGASGLLALSIPLAGSAVGQAGSSGGISHGVPLAAVAQAIAAASGNLSAGQLQALQGAAAAQAGASGALALSVALLGTALGAAGASGALSISKALQGAAVAVAAGSGTLALGAGLAGSALAQAAASGVLTLAVRLAGSAAAQAGAAGTLFLTVPLVGPAQALAAASGALALTVLLGGAATSQAAAGGALHVAVQLAGAAGGQATVSGVLTAFAEGTEAAHALQAAALPRRWRASARPRNWQADAPARTWEARASALH